MVNSGRSYAGRHISGKWRAYRILDPLLKITKTCAPLWKERRGCVPFRLRVPNVNINQLFGVLFNTDRSNRRIGNHGNNSVPANRLAPRDSRELNFGFLTSRWSGLAWPPIVVKGVVGGSLQSSVDWRSLGGGEGDDRVTCKNQNRAPSRARRCAIASLRRPAVDDRIQPRNRSRFTNPWN